MKEELEEVIETHKNLIYKIASKFTRFYNVEDLFQVGVIGLIKAYRNYKKDSNAKLSTYSIKYIYGEILEYIRCDRTMKVSTDALKIYKLYTCTKEKLTCEYGKVPSLKEISSYLNIDEQTLSETIERCQFVVSLDGIITEDDFTLEKVTGTDERTKIDTLIDIRNELEKLSETDKKLIDLRYFQDLSQKETGELLGMNQVQVSRYEKLILKKMHQNLVA